MKNQNQSKNPKVPKSCNQEYKLQWKWKTTHPWITPCSPTCCSSAHRAQLRRKWKERLGGETVSTEYGLQPNLNLEATWKTKKIHEALPNGHFLRDYDLWVIIK